MTFPYKTRSFHAIKESLSLEELDKQEIIVGDKASLEYFTHQIADFSQETSIPAILSSIDINLAEQWLVSEGLDTLRTEHTTIENIPAKEYGVDEGDLKKAKQQIELAVIQDCDPDEATLYIAQIPCEHTWEIPAYLYVDAANEILTTAVHCALLKRWCDRYHARIICITENMIECVVEHPPSTDQEALALALEQSIYSPDIIESMGSVGRLASHLKDNKQWFFWWD